ncbi:unnamed protein product [Callosobruchus maculatus]|uniref:Uncharacterized protein n=1 Tax=Callosobruchus maculatus TaxID=64391 RepID=A0A653CPX2_CALMS|nr:unnamed protein product [Callosobruchus maculatus]
MGWDGLLERKKGRKILACILCMLAEPIKCLCYIYLHLSIKGGEN